MTVTDNVYNVAENIILFYFWILPYFSTLYLFICSLVIIIKSEEKISRNNLKRNEDNFVDNEFSKFLTQEALITIL